MGPEFTYPASRYNICIMTPWKYWVPTTFYWSQYPIMEPLEADQTRDQLIGLKKSLTIFVFETLKMGQGGMTEDWVGNTYDSPFYHIPIWVDYPREEVGRLTEPKIIQLLSSNFDEGQRGTGKLQLIVPWNEVKVVWNGY